MDLKQYLRRDFADNLRPLLIKNECECCGTSKNLELHHVKAFAVILKETLESLQLEYFEDIEKYTDKELDNIRNIMLGWQTRISYETLCEDCHSNLHTRNGGKFNNGNRFRIYLEKKLKEKEDNIKQSINNVDNTLVDDFLNNGLPDKYIGFKLSREDKDIISKLYYLKIKYRITDHDINFKSTQKYLKEDGFISKSIRNKGTYIFKHNEEIMKDSIKEIKKIDKENENREIYDYLSSINGVFLNKSQQNKLIDKINVKINGRQQRSCSKITEYLNSINIPFVINSIRKNVKGNKNTHWIVSKI